MEITLIRHTTPDVEKGICYGQSDIPLKDTFMHECDQILNSMPPYIEIIYTSPLKRCVKLAQWLGETLCITVQKDERLKELDFGDWEMKHWNGIEQQQLMRWMNNYEHECCPNGESYQDLKARVSDFYNDLQRKAQKHILIVTHGGVIKTSYALFNDQPLETAIRITADYGSIHRFYS